MTSASSPLTSGRNLVSPSETERFLRQYYAAALEEGEGRLAVFTLPNKRTFASNDISCVAQHAARQAQAGQNSYFHIHVHDIAEGGSHLRGCRDSARVVIGLYADIDAVGPGRRKSLETLCPRVEDAVWVARQFDVRYKPLRISFVISSGYGCYPAILLKEPLALKGKDDRVLVESLGRRFHESLREIAAERGWTGAVDYCDIAKVLRLPGCVNWKDMDNPQPVRLLQHEDSARFNVRDLQEWLPTLRAHGDLFIATSDPNKNISINLDQEMVVPDSLLAALRAQHPFFTSTWDHHRNDLKDQSCSGYDMALAGIGVACGLPDQQIASLIVLNRRRYKGDKQERKGEAYRKYLLRTIEKAREGGISARQADRQWAELQQQVHAASEDSQVGEGQIQAGEPEGKTIQSSFASENLDNGHAGVKSSDPVACSPLEFVLAKVRSTGDVNDLYNHIDVVAALSDARVAAAFQGFKVILGTKLNFQHFNKAIKDARLRRHRRSRSSQQESDTRPLIVTLRIFLPLKKSLFSN